VLLRKTEGFFLVELLLWVWRREKVGGGVEF
jgi:hypothetical protein